VNLTRSGGREVFEAVRPTSNEARICALGCIFESLAGEEVRGLSGPVVSELVEEGERRGLRVEAPARA
jgi:hypothetical protein